MDECSLVRHAVHLCCSPRLAKRCALLHCAARARSGERQRHLSSSLQPSHDGWALNCRVRSYVRSSWNALRRQSYQVPPLRRRTWCGRCWRQCASRRGKWWTPCARTPGSIAWRYADDAANAVRPVRRVGQTSHSASTAAVAPSCPKQSGAKPADSTTLEGSGLQRCRISRVQVLRADGGASANDLLLQLQADLLQASVPIQSPVCLWYFAVFVSIVCQSSANKLLQLAFFAMIHLVQHGLAALAMTARVLIVLPDLGTGPSAQASAPGNHLPGCRLRRRYAG